MKKLYVIPAILVSDAVPCDILAASKQLTEKARTNYLCPHIPGTRCRSYNHYVREKNDVLTPPSDVPPHCRISMPGPEECPYTATCSRL